MAASQSNGQGASVKGAKLLKRVMSDFIGLNTTYPLASGGQSRRVYLDSTASTLMMGVAQQAIGAMLEHYANTHSLLHNSARLATSNYRWAHERMLSFVGADPDIYTAYFTGSGATAGMNRLARLFKELRPDRDTALVSIMEHHSNDLPHRKHLGRVVHLPNKMRVGSVDLVALEALLEQEQGRVNYIAVTGVSNVTGIINPIHEIAKLAHKYDAFILVDAAQMVAHIPVQMSGRDDPEENIDALVFSGHKTYVPGSPGVVVARLDHLMQTEPVEVGGGMVARVLVDHYSVTNKFPDREEAGTPNIPGAIGLATAIEVLDRIGMQLLYDEEEQLLAYALEQMMSVPGVIIYGDPDIKACPRVSAISFNVGDKHHSIVAAILNDYHNIAVRNECFCAHPYVIEMMPEETADFVALSDEAVIDLQAPKPGMVRASFGLYNTRADIDRLRTALEDIQQNFDQYAPLYEIGGSDHEYQHTSFEAAGEATFNIPGMLDSLLTRDP
ncbi:MAG: aminotransferase class V-fold PLP-dependent enzyme [Candidatus Marinimicrobia bacterium]|nr:aminotransferase class V-fold PLP-dependent enzyme [Candidatus Neomarinimicrobiota bacterium]